MTQCFPSRCLFCSSVTAFRLPYSFKASLLPVDTRKKPRNMLDTLRCAGSSARGPSWPADAASSTSASPPSSSERWLSMSFSSTDVASLEDPLKQQEQAPRIRLAQVCLWGGMTWLALVVNWGESPSSVASLALVLGVCLIVVAKVLPGVVLSYLLGELLRGCVSAAVQVGSCTAQLVFGSCPPLTACPCLEA